MRRIRKGDEVQVLAGRDKGRRGTVKRVLAAGPGRRPDHVVVEGINVRIRHTRPNPAKNDPGGRIGVETKIHVSNVGLYNPAKKGPDRVRIVTDGRGRKSRVFASDGKEVE